MSAPEATLSRIAAAVEHGARGERDRARSILTDLWERIGTTGDALHRCALAHAMADLQDEPDVELRWDLLALQAADGVTDDRLRLAGMPGPVAGLYPSLHLNLAEDYRKLGNTAAARRHLELGRAAASSLGDDGYGQMVRRGLDALGGQLADP